MVCSNQSRERLRLTVTRIVYRRAERTVASCPVVERYPVEIIVEGALSLFVDDSENLGDRGEP